MSLDRRALGGPGKPRGPRGHPRAVALQDRPRRRAGPAEPPHRRDRQSRGPEPAPLLGLPCIPLRGFPRGPAPARGGRTGRPRSDARAPGTGSGRLERSPNNSVPLPHGCPPVSCRRTGQTERGSGAGVSPRRSIPPRPRVTTPRLGVNVPASPLPAAQLPRGEQSRCQRRGTGSAAADPRLSPVPPPLRGRPTSAPSPSGTLQLLTRRGGGAQQEQRQERGAPRCPHGAAGAAGAMRSAAGRGGARGRGRRGRRGGNKEPSITGRIPGTPAGDPPRLRPRRGQRARAGAAHWARVFGGPPALPAPGQPPLTAPVHREVRRAGWGRHSSAGASLPGKAGPVRGCPTPRSPRAGRAPGPVRTAGGCSGR